MSYENPTTYVDTESSKILANAITGVGQMTAKYISDDIKKKAKIAEENKIENKKKAQAFKRYQIAGQENVNEATKDLDFTGNESFRNATGGIIDQLAKAKSDYEFSTDPEESKRLSKEIYQLDSFLKNGFTGQMDDLQNDIETMKEIMNNPGVEGGLDQYQDSNYTTMLMAMANGDDAGEMTFEIIDGKIEMTLKGDMYNQNRQDDTKGVYKVDLKANQSTEVAKIPVLNMRTPTQKGGKSVLQTAGIIDDQGQIPIDSFSEEIGETKDLANNTTLFKYKINEETENKIISAVEMEVAGLLKGGEGLAGGFTGADSYYRNILLTDDEANGNVEGVMPFLETGSYEVKDDKGNVKYVVPITEESYKALVDRISKREIDYVNSQMKPQTRATVSTDNGGKGTKEERNVELATNELMTTDIVAISSGDGVAEIYNRIKSEPLTYNYDDAAQVKTAIMTQKEFKEEIANTSPADLNKQKLVYFTKAELVNPYNQDGTLKTKIQDKINAKLSELGDDENTFVDYNTGTTLNDRQALTMLLKSTPKYSNLDSKEINKMVNSALENENRPKKESDEFEEDLSKFQTDNVDDVESGEFSKEYESATEEIGPAKRPAFSQTDSSIFGVKIGNKDKYKERKKERSKLVTKQKKDRKFLEQKYPNVTWPWEK